MLMGEMSYKDAGVNVDLGNDVSKILFEAAKKTWENRSGRLGEIVEISSDFSGLRGIHVGGLPVGTYLGSGSDGVGTKIEVAERIGRHNSIAYDLFAMVCDDAIIRGAEPVIVTSDLSINRFGDNQNNYIDFVKELAKGYVDAAKQTGVAVINGESAELGDRIRGYGDFNYNWNASVIWFGKKDRMFTREKIKAGDKLVGLEEEGFRSNGLSLVREILSRKLHREWHDTPWKKTEYYYGEFSHLPPMQTIGDMVLRPSKIYTKAIVDMFGGFEGEPKVDIHGVAHITGGGIPEKLGRVLNPLGLGAMIDEPFKPSEFVSYVQALGNVSDREAYKTWNMGQGMILITNDVDGVVKVSENHGIKAKYIGEVVSESGIKIKNRGVFNPEDC